LFYSLEIKINLPNSLKFVPKISFAGRSCLSLLLKNHSNRRGNKRKIATDNCKPCNEQFFAVVSSLENVEQKTLKKS
jgi:hypothetical protein